MKRVRLGIPLIYDENWAGGYYYIINLIKALKLLRDHEKPKILVISDDRVKFNKIRKETGYQYLYFRFVHSKYEWVYRTSKKISDRLTFRLTKKYEPKDFDYIFPFRKIPTIKVNDKSRIWWIPDFQEEYLPEFFSKEELEKRHNRNHKITITSDKLILSSNSAFLNLKEKFPDYNCKPNVVRFAVTNQFEKQGRDTLLKKYQLNSKFLYCPNQFWQHKNQRFLIEAVIKSPKTFDGIQLVFSGNEQDYRGERHIKEMKQIVLENNLDESIKFLGFIPKMDVIELMQYAFSVVQPSLFEGWSTVVEDAKSQNAFICASDIDVHKEQLKNYPNKDFFDPRNVEDYVNLINRLSRASVVKQEYDYEINRRSYAREFMNCLLS